MNQPRRRSQNRRRGGQQRPRPLDLWRPTPELPAPEPIVPAADPTAMLRSLGDPPLHRGAEHYLAAVIERAAVLATALAASADLVGGVDQG